MRDHLILGPTCKKQSIRWVCNRAIKYWIREQGTKLLGGETSPKLQPREKKISWSIATMHIHISIYIYMNMCTLDTTRSLSRARPLPQNPAHVQESYYGIVLRNSITELYHGVISWNCIIELDYRIILQNFITESCYGIAPRQFSMETYHWIMFRI